MRMSSGKKKSIAHRRQITTLALEIVGEEKTRVDKGAAIKVRINDPTKRLGSFDRPSEIAPSSRKGSTTKYALNI